MSDEQPASKKRARKAPGAKSAPKGPPRKQAKTGADPDAPAAPATPPGAPPTSLIRVPLSVRWRDLDAFNHVNNSKFLSYLEEARLRWMIQLPGEWIDDNVAPVVAAAHVNYRRPIAWPNEVVVELFVERLGGTSLTIGHRIVHADDASVLYADGNVVMVWIDKQRGQPSPLPDAVRKACS
jgi:acyl-CoA thioester hydrolase